MFAVPNRKTYLIHLVANNDLHHCWRDIRLKLRKPFRQRVKRFAVSDVVHEDNPLRAAVVGRCDCPKAFLSSGILQCSESEYIEVIKIPASYFGSDDALTQILNLTFFPPTSILCTCQTRSQPTAGSHPIIHDSMGYSPESLHRSLLLPRPPVAIAHPRSAAVNYSSLQTSFQ